MKLSTLKFLTGEDYLRYAYTLEHGGSVTVCEVLGSSIVCIVVGCLGALFISLFAAMALCFPWAVYMVYELYNGVVFENLLPSSQVATVTGFSGMFMLAFWFVWDALEKLFSFIKMKYSKLKLKGISCPTIKIKE